MIDVANLCMGCMEQKGSEVVCPACGFKEGTEPDSPLHLRPRTELHGQYLVGKVLGHGGFGITYLGWDLNLERKIAIKEYLPSGVAVRTGINSEVIPFSGETRKDFEYGLERYLDEARTVARFQMHPSVVSVLNFFRANGTAYLVMEYLEGATFERYLESNGGKTNIDTVMTVMIPVLEALGSVHSQGILHRDISPDNVYITRKWQVKVLDFGAARYALGQKSRNLSVILKEGYAPVEQYHSKGNQGPWTDAYACGATIYRALTGKIPPSSLDRMQTDDMEPPSALGVELADFQERAILKALSVHPDKRFKTMLEFKEALTGAAPTDVIEQTGEKLRAGNVAVVPDGPVVTGPKQVKTVKSGTPEPSPVVVPPDPQPRLDSEREAAHSRRGQSAKMPRWIWASAAGMLLAVAGIGGYKSYQDHLRELELKQKQERARILQEEEKKRLDALAAETEKRNRERQAELQRLQQQQEELDRKNRELEQKERELQDLKNKNVRIPPNNQSKNQQQQQQQQQQYYAQLLESQKRERERLEAERKQLQERYQQQNRNNQNRIVIPTPAPTPAPPTPGPFGGVNYEGLLQQAESASRSRNYQAALQLNQQAIQANPARPEAYSNLGWISLYGTGDLQRASAAYKDAISRGGTVWFRVRHDHYQMTYNDFCEGNLGISKEGIRYTTPNGAHNFVLGRAAIREIKENKIFSAVLRKGIKDDFHIKTTDDRNFNMLPAGNARQIRDMIVQLAK